MLFPADSLRCEFFRGGGGFVVQTHCAAVAAQNPTNTTKALVNGDRTEAVVGIAVGPKGILYPRTPLGCWAFPFKGWGWLWQPRGLDPPFPQTSPKKGSCDGTLQTYQGTSRVQWRGEAGRGGCPRGQSGGGGGGVEGVRGQRIAMGGGRLLMVRVHIGQAQTLTLMLILTLTLT